MYSLSLYWNVGNPPTVGKNCNKTMYVLHLTVNTCVLEFVTYNVPEDNGHTSDMD